MYTISWMIFLIGLLSGPLFKVLGQLAVEPIGQILDGLHVAGLTARDVDLCDLAQFFMLSPAAASSMRRASR
jgi:hypothetical protein